MPQNDKKYEQSHFETEIVEIEGLRKHPSNYKTHPQDQIEHLIESIRKFGIYRNVTIAKDGTILAGHGVVQAALQMGMESIPVVRLDLEYDDPRALKLLTGDNEITNLAEIDDRGLTDMLKQIKDSDPDGLLGTGFSDQMLASLVMVTRPQSEIASFDEAAEWVGMPEYDGMPASIGLVVHFENMEAKVEFGRILKQQINPETSKIWWPYKQKDDVRSVKLKG